MTPMTDEQSRFLALHVRHVIVKWEWLFRGSMLRATTEHGDVATITARGFAHLVDAGLVEAVGVAGVRLKGVAA